MRLIPSFLVHDTALGGGKALFDLRFGCGTLLDSMSESVLSIDHGWE
jgi:hypothetical protein